MSNLSGKILTERELKLARKTIGASAFYYVVCHHVLSDLSLSVVRMGDGEKIILDIARNVNPDRFINERFEDAWVERMGMVGATAGQIAALIDEAVSTCDFFAPNVHGLVWDTFDLYKYYPDRQEFVDNFFVTDWSKERILELYGFAKNIVVLHRDENVGKSFEQSSNSMYNFTYIPLSNWDEVDSVIEQVANTDCKLVLISGAKVIGPRLAKNHNKVCIDIGNSMHRWIP